MVSCPEHDNCIPGVPQDGGWLGSRKGNRISGPCLWHRCDGQDLRKSSSSFDVAA
ncbi:receptor-like kinase4 [Zea mays]|uniref:Receptor-like kinase4 n=1 Tax=Zea mays TaxID=4577 RepID=A0A1D6FD49_MAIZE|nr:receptor-like kinase4 [Zea mays]